MKNINYFNVSEKPFGPQDIKIANVFHHPVQAKNMKFNPSEYENFMYTGMPLERGTWAPQSATVL